MRKIFLGWGAKDEGTPEPMYRAFCDAIKSSDKKALTVFEEPEHGHEITMPMLEAALGFLKENLIIRQGQGKTKEQPLRA